METQDDQADVEETMVGTLPKILQEIAKEGDYQRRI